MDWLFFIWSNNSNVITLLELLDFKTEIFPNIVAGFGENQSDFDKIIQELDKQNEHMQRILKKYGH